MIHFKIQIINYLYFRKELFITNIIMLLYNIIYNV